MSNNHPLTDNDKQFCIAALAGICFACLKPITKLGPLVTLIWFSICSFFVYRLATYAREVYLSAPPTKAELLEDAEDEAAAEEAATREERGLSTRYWPRQRLASPSRNI